MGKMKQYDDVKVLSELLADEKAGRNDRETIHALESAIRAVKADRAQPAPAVVDDVARDAARWRWMRDNAKEMTYDRLLDIVEEYGAKADAKVDAAMLAASAPKEGK